jgi:adenosylhomocysteine nucleosidase
LIGSRELPVRISIDGSDVTAMKAGPIGIMVGLDKELRPYRDRVARVEHHKVAGVEIIGGELAGRNVLLTNAGLGKVNASIAATMLYDRFDCELILFPGLAGGLAPDLEAGAVIVATELIQHDYGDWIDGKFHLTQPSPPPGLPKAGAGFLLPPSIERIARDVAANQPIKIHFGRVITGDVFVLCQMTRERLFCDHQALALEMEGAALAQVAERFGRQYLVVRVLGDLAGAIHQLDARTTSRRLDEAANFVQAIIAAHGQVANRGIAAQ